MLAIAAVSASDIACIGITNQRKTTLVWVRRTGKLIYRAIVWQDRCSSEWCNEMKQDAVMVDMI
ncbi:MAG: FGGY family carbohydrate kinase [Gammaproteobacteria bacterium]|nr:FGGY family carbohydrate kinase [Gammaproteobacteria bacterium]